MSLRSSRSSISPFRSRKAPTPPASKSNPRPTAPSSFARPSTPSSSCSSRAPTRLSPVSPVSPSSERQDIIAKSKENVTVTVTVRFRPLSAREINKGDEIAWYADGDYTLRNEYNSSIAYGFEVPLCIQFTRMFTFLGRKMRRHLFLHVDPKHNTTSH